MASTFFSSRFSTAWYAAIASWYRPSIKLCRAALSIPASISGGIVFIGAPDLPWSSGPGSGLASTGRRLSGGIMVSAGVV